MSVIGTKQEYDAGFGDAALNLGLEGSTTANTALLKATLAFDRIERHEMECSKRWSIVIKLMLLVLAQVGTLLVFLLSEKLGWLL